MSTQVFRNRWWVIFASVLGLIVGSGTIMVFATSVFMKPMSQQLGFGRGTISSAVSLANIISGLTIPFYGRLMDRYGVRRVLLPFIALFALATAGLSLISASMSMLMILFAFQGLVSSSQNTTGYSKMITARFDRQRGLALGIALSGIGLGTILIPQYARVLLQHFGWRGGYIGLGCAIMVLAFIPVAVFFGESEEIRNAREHSVQHPKETNLALPGLSFSESIRTGTYWAITIAIFLSITSINGTLMHLVPLLTDRGISVSAATAALSFSGMALILGRLISGYALDKIFAAYIAIFFLVVPMAGIAIIATGTVSPIIGVVMLGLSVGAEFDLLAFLVGRYFGVKSFGALCGLSMLFVYFANATGTGLMGWCFQLKHSYTPMFGVFELMLVVAIILMARLGPYRFPAPKRDTKKTAETVGAVASGH